MTALDRAARVIRSALADGPRTAGQVERAGTEAGVSVRTLRRAADRLGVVRNHRGARSTWSLPSTTTTPGTDPGGTEIDQMKTPASLVLLAISDGLTINGRVLARGDRVELDADALAATRDRFGASWTDDLSPAAQMARWGAVHVVVDDTPPDTVTEPDRVTRDTDTVAARPAPIRPDPVGTLNAPSNFRLTPEGRVPFLVGFGGDGPIRVVPDTAGR